MIAIVRKKSYKSKHFLLLLVASILGQNQHSFAASPAPAAAAQGVVLNSAWYGGDQVGAPQDPGILDSVQPKISGNNFNIPGGFFSFYGQDPWNESQCKALSLDVSVDGFPLQLRGIEGTPLVFSITAAAAAGSATPEVATPQAQTMQTGLYQIALRPTLPMQIVQATYGVIARDSNGRVTGIDPSKSMDVTAMVKADVVTNGGYIWYPTANYNGRFKKDPAPGIVKQLNIVARIGGTDFTITSANEGTPFFFYPVDKNAAAPAALSSMKASSFKPKLAAWWFGRDDEPIRLNTPSIQSYIQNIIDKYGFLVLPAGYPALYYAADQNMYDFLPGMEKFTKFVLEVNGVVYQPEASENTDFVFPANLVPAAQAASALNELKAALALAKSSVPRPVAAAADRGNQLMYNTLVNISPAIAPNTNAWAHGGNRLNNQPSTCEILLGSPATDPRPIAGYNFAILLKNGDTANKGPVNYGDQFTIVYLAAGSGYPALSGPADAGLVWYVNNDNRWNNSFPDKPFCEILLANGTTPQAQSNQLFSLASPTGLSGAVFQNDLVYITVASSSVSPDPKSGQARRVWFLPSNRWGNYYGELMVGDNMGRDIEGGKMLIRQASLTDQNKAVYSQITKLSVMANAAAATPVPAAPIVSVPLTYNKLITISPTNAGSGANVVSVTGNKHICAMSANRLGLTNVGDVAIGNSTSGYDFIILRKSDDLGNTGPVNYGDQFEIISLVAGPVGGTGSSGPNPNGLLWYVNQYSRHNPNAAAAPYCEILLADRTSSAAQTAIKNSMHLFTLSDASGQAKPGAVSTGDQVYILTASPNIEPDQNTGQTRRIWCYGDSRYGNGWFELLVGESSGYSRDNLAGRMIMQPVVPDANNGVVYNLVLKLPILAPPAPAATPAAPAVTPAATPGATTPAVTTAAVSAPGATPAPAAVPTAATPAPAAPTAPAQAIAAESPAAVIAAAKSATKPKPIKAVTAGAKKVAGKATTKPSGKGAIKQGAQAGAKAGTKAVTQPATGQAKPAPSKKAVATTGKSAAKADTSKAAPKSTTAKAAPKTSTSKAAPKSSTTKATAKPATASKAVAKSTATKAAPKTGASKAAPKSTTAKAAPKTGTSKAAPKSSATKATAKPATASKRVA